MSIHRSTQTASAPEYLGRRAAPLAFSIRVSVYLAGICAFVAGGMLLPLPYMLFCIAGLGLALAHGTELSHQSLHATGFGGRFADTVFGRIASTLTLTSYHRYQATHLWHHRANGTLKDEESFSYDFSFAGRNSRLYRLAGFAKHLLMVSHFSETVRCMYLALRGKLAKHLLVRHPYLSGDAIAAIRGDYLVCLAYMGVILSLGFVIDPWRVLFVWTGSLLVWAAAHALIELPEHWKTASRPEQDTFRNTRTIQAGRLASYYTNGNCFHVEHHAYAGMPMHSLRRVHTQLIRNGAPYAYLDTGYAEFFAAFLHDLLATSPSPAPEQEETHD